MKEEQNLEAVFAAALEENLQKAEQAGVRDARLRQAAQKYGAVRAVKEVLRKKKETDGFRALAAENLTALSVEALVAQEKFGALFTDDEVNLCYALLCEEGYFG